jgi:hypothetical protein
MKKITSCFSAISVELNLLTVLELPFCSHIEPFGAKAVRPVNPVSNTRQ